MERTIRSLNILDVRYIARILRDSYLSKTEITDIVKRFSEVSKESGDIAVYIDILYPVYEAILAVLGDSDALLEFLASLYGVSVNELSEIGFSNIPSLIAQLKQDPETTAFFTSASQAMRQT